MWGPQVSHEYVGREATRMVSGNAAILRHAEEGRALRVFQGARGTVRYEGEFELDSEQPWYTTDAPETGDGPVRNVIVFRLRPLDTAPKPAQTKLDAVINGSVSTEVPVEEQWTERAFV